jgi:hypothetical protein
MAKLLTPAPIITTIPTPDKVACSLILQTIFYEIKKKHS